MSRIQSEDRFIVSTGEKQLDSEYWSTIAYRTVTNVEYVRLSSSQLRDLQYHWVSAEIAPPINRDVNRRKVSDSTGLDSHSFETGWKATFWR